MGTMYRHYDVMYWPEGHATRRVGGCATLAGIDCQHVRWHVTRLVVDHYTEISREGVLDWGGLDAGEDLQHTVKHVKNEFIVRWHQINVGLTQDRSIPDLL